MLQFSLLDFLSTDFTVCFYFRISLRHSFCQYSCQFKNYVSYFFQVSDSHTNFVLRQSETAKYESVLGTVSHSL
jgi:hypothetical protein